MTVIITRYKGTESCGLSRSKENKMVEKPHPNMAASKDRTAQGTRTRRQRSPVWLSLPPAVSVPWDWYCLGQLPTCGVSSSASFWPARPSWFGHCSSKLLLLCGERKLTHWALKPTALAPTAPYPCCGCVL